MREGGRGRRVGSEGVREVGGGEEGREWCIGLC